MESEEFNEELYNAVITAINNDNDEMLKNNGYSSSNENSRFENKKED